MNRFSLKKVDCQPTDLLWRRSTLPGTEFTLVLERIFVPWSPQSFISWIKSNAFRITEKFISKQLFAMFNCREAKLNNQASNIHSQPDARNIIKIINCTKCFELHNSSLNMPLSLMCAYPWEGVCTKIQCCIKLKVLLARFNCMFRLLMLHHR